MDGISLLGKLHQEYPDTCIIILTGFGTGDSPAKARRAGAFDFFAKPIDFDSLSRRIDAAINQFRSERENYYQIEEAKRQLHFESIVAQSTAMRKVFDLIQKVVDTDETILITGESGTGKDLIAVAIHYNSQRKKETLIKADCAGLPEELAESELFGHEKGAFTGAIADRVGKFELADGTTLFLDEIGDLSLRLQLKFLRFLQEKIFERVGGNEKIEVNVRIIAATNKNLPKEVNQGRFREDLFHRLNRFVITVPPLRKRHGDIPLLVNHFIKKYNRRNTKMIKDISKPALELLEDYHFPGNVRELENIIASAILLEDGEVIKPETIRMRLVQPVADFQPNYRNLTFREARRIFEKAYFTQLLEQTSGNISQAARLAELDRTHLRNKMKSLGMRGVDDNGIVE
jgi:DNA-binding NtrC family response regulator